MTDNKPCPCQTGEVKPVDVHLASADPGVLQPAAAPRPRIGCRTYTVVLTSTSPVDTILDQDDKRSYALVQAGGNDAVISNNKTEAFAKENLVAGLPTPIGMVLPFGNTAPTKIPGGDRWWAAAAAYPTQITVLVVQED